MLRFRPSSLPDDAVDREDGGAQRLEEAYGVAGAFPEVSLTYRQER